MFCSTIIPTIGRPTLSRAAESVLNQAISAASFEVIVVNDSGRPLPKADWQRSERVRVINTACRERSVARNAGAAVSLGRYLHFLDDDDWLFPDALQTLWNLANAHEVAWLYGGSQLVDRQGKPLIQLHHGLNGNCFIQVMAGEWIPLQASLIESKTFFAVGGFSPRLSGPEDIDLLRRIALRSDIAGAETLVACIVRGTAGSTTDYDRHAEMSRVARERVLNLPEVFTRMRTSSHSGYWRGRVVRVYLTSMLWNLQRKCLFLAASRAIFGIAGLGLASPHLFSSSLWRAIAKPYASETFARGLQKARALT